MNDRLKTVTFTYDPTMNPPVVEIEGWSTMQDLIIIESAITPTIERYLQQFNEKKLLNIMEMLDES